MKIFAAAASIATSTGVVAATPGFGIFSLYEDTSCSGAPTYAEFRYGHDECNPVEPLCEPYEYNDRVHIIRNCMTDPIRAMDTLFGEAPYFLEVDYDAGSIFGGSSYRADGACHSAAGEGMQVTIQTDGSVLGTGYPHFCSNTTSTYSWNVSSEVIRTHEPVTENIGNYEYVVYYTSNGTTASTGTRSTTGNSTGTTSGTTNTTTNATTTTSGGAASGRRSAGTLVVGLAGVLAVVTSAML